MLQRVGSKGESLTLLVGMFIGVWSVDNCVEIPQKTQKWITIWSGNPTPAHLSRENHDLKRQMYSNVHTIAKTWKQPKCPSTEEWTKKRWHIYTMEYYSAIKRNKIPAFFATWMGLETIMLSEVSHTMRHQHQMLSLTCGTEKGQTELLCRIDADSQTLKNLWSPEETVWGVGGYA